MVLNGARSTASVLMFPFFSVEQVQDQCWLYQGFLTGVYLSPVGLRAAYLLGCGPCNNQVPIASANVDHNLCCGL